MKSLRDRISQVVPARSALWVALLLLLGPAVGRAQTGCRVELPPGPVLQFPPYIPTNTTAPATGLTTFVIDCKPGKTLVTISLSAGLGGSFNPRAMLQGAWRLEYNLYEDAGLTRIWGDGSSGTVTRTTEGDQKITQTIWADVPLGQFPAAGDYADTITMTVTFFP